jgi:hypothetical protein
MGRRLEYSSRNFKPGAPWWSLFGVLSCDEIWKRRRRRGRKACATACSVRIFKIGSPSWVVIYLVHIFSLESHKSLESVVTFSHHHMLNRRPSRIEVKPEDRQEEVQTKKKRRSVVSFVRSSFSFKLLLSLSVVSASVSVLNLLLTFKLIPFSLSKQYDDSRRAHVERLKQQIALQGPSPSGLDDGDDDVRGFVNAHHPLLQRPTTDARIGFIPPPHPPSHQ